MKDYKMLNFEQWKHWLDNADNMYYRIGDYPDFDCIEIIIYGSGYHNVVLTFNENSGELINIDID